MGNESPLRLFISHSSHAPARTGRSEAEKQSDAVAEARARQVVDGVATLLGADGYRILLDMHCIEEGQMWRRYIHEALVECDAAVIFLSEWSLASAWVRYEATVLTERAWQDDQFKLFPLVLPNTDKTKLES